MKDIVKEEAFKLIEDMIKTTEIKNKYIEVLLKEKEELKKVNKTLLELLNN